MDNMKDMDLVTLIEHFRGEDRCRKTLEELRWPDGVECPRCGSSSIARLKTNSIFDCNSCRYQFSVKAGTVFHDSHLPLWKWFLTVFMMAESKKGVSANQIKRMLGVSYKTAWYLCHRIRAAMTEVDPDPLSGEVEVDETFVGGKVRGKGYGYRKNKTIVAGAVQRGGDTRLQVVDGRSRKALHGFIRDTLLAKRR